MYVSEQRHRESQVDGNITFSMKGLDSATCSNTQGLFINYFTYLYIYIYILFVFVNASSLIFARANQSVIKCCAQRFAWLNIYLMDGMTFRFCLVHFYFQTIQIENCLRTEPCSYSKKTSSVHINPDDLNDERIIISNEHFEAQQQRKTKTLIISINAIAGVQTYTRSISHKCSAYMKWLH